ncbi:MAG: hypothetical protein MI922_01830, partial [Bacteroidales bacterium]|nr:hypothetical protein [Bacteroidales bacterium]
MKNITIKVTERKSTGKKDTKELRKEGRVPCVMYGGEKNIHFSGQANDLRHILYTTVYIQETKQIFFHYYNYVSSILKPFVCVCVCVRMCVCGPALPLLLLDFIAVPVMDFFFFLRKPLQQQLG